MGRKAAKPGADGLDEIVTIRVELCDSDPPIWREVEVPTSVTLKVLNDIIQIVMGWTNSHLWEFTIGKKQYGLPADEDWRDKPLISAAGARLRDVLQPPKTTINYLYDFGDSWEHLLTVTGLRQGSPGLLYPRYLGGERNGPPEDCGGIPGFYAALEARADPSHPDHDEVAEWLGEYDPDLIDELQIGYALRRIAKRRNAGRARLAGGRARPPE
jgi:hypothetical protein